MAFFDERRSLVLGLNLLDFSFCLGQLVLAELDQSLCFFQLHSDFIYAVLVALHLAHDVLQLCEGFFVFLFLAHFTIDLMVPFSSRVSISSPACSCVASRTILPSFIVIL